MRYRMMAVLALAGVVGSAGMIAFTDPAVAQGSSPYRNEISNNMSHCAPDKGPALLVTVEGIKSATGTVRVQSYHATSAEWMAKGKWLSRIEIPARAGQMRFCVPLPASGTYGIAVRHDANGNGSTDLKSDGGAMSNNPSINLFNLGKPSYTKVGVPVHAEVKPIHINMRYM